MTIPDAAIEAAAKAIHGATTREPKWALTADAYKRFYRAEARAAIEAAMPAIREALAQEIEAESPKVGGMLSGAQADGYRDAARIVRGGAE